MNVDDIFEAFSKKDISSPSKTYFNRDDKGRFLSNFEGSSKKKGSKYSRLNNKLSSMEYDLEALFKERRLSVSSFIDYCEAIHINFSRAKVYNDFKRPWKSLSLVDKILYLGFLKL